jgi:pimeloyl-ACP methyl ester carboxylesterase
MRRFARLACVLLAASVLLAAAALTPPARAESCNDRFFDSKGVPIRYCVAGDGPPVVVIHGSSGAWRGRTADAFGPLAERHTLIGFDVRGHGKSGKPHDPDQYGPELVDDVVRLLDHLKIGSAHLVGYSMGGFIGLKLVTLYPERIRSLVLVGQGLLSVDDFAQMAENADARQREDGNDPIAIAAMIRSYPALAVSDSALRSIRVPVLAIVGDRDPRVGRAGRLRSALPGARLIVLPGRDHATVIQDPRMIPEILNFLSRSDARDTGRAR